MWTFTPLDHYGFILETVAERPTAVSAEVFSAAITNRGFALGLPRAMRNGYASGGNARQGCASYCGHSSARRSSPGLAATGMRTKLLTLGSCRIGGQAERGGLAVDADVYADAARVLYYSSHGDWDSLRRLMDENSMERLNLIGKAGLELGQLAYIPALAGTAV